MGLSGKYSLSGASIPANAQTFSVAYIPNNAANVAVTLSNDLTEALRDRFVRQTRLTQVPEGGDLAFEGEIMSDVEAPASISAESEGAQTNRVTITVQIRFTNAIDPTADFSQSFSAFAEFNAQQSTRQEVESALLEEIVTTLVDNIFNASVAQW
jgi:hypothetical protein